MTSAEALKALIRPRSSMITTASKVASSSASTSGVGAVMPARYSLRGEGCEANWLGGVRARAGSRGAQELRVHFRLGGDPVFDLVAGSESALLRAEECGFR